MRMSVSALRRSGLRIASITPLSPVTSQLRRVLSGPTPHDLLWEALVTRYANAQREFKDAVPGRRYRLDIAIPDVNLAIEVDGFQFHGKYLADFKRDRERQNLLVLNGWRVLRFTAADIRRNLSGVLACIAAAAATGRTVP